MTTFEAFAREGWKAAKAARAERRARIRSAGKATLTGLAAARRSLLQFAGLAGFTVAAWSTDYRLGLTVGAICTFVLVWLLDGD